MNSQLLGVPNLQRALDELSDFTRPGWKNAMRAGVRKPGGQILRTAKANISRLSPGKALMHRTYRGRLVGAGFASRNLRMIVKINREGTSVTAIMGVRAEAFYALQFFEKGTSKIPKQPWLVPALEAEKENAVDDVGTAIADRLTKISAKYLASSPRI